MGAAEGGGDSVRHRAGNASGAGGHADPRNGLNRELWHVENESRINTCNGADDCRRAVRDQIGLGAEWIKITATGGVLSNVAGGLAKQVAESTYQVRSRRGLHVYVFVQSAVFLPRRDAIHLVAH